jgi:hypothetical protein
MLSVKGLDPGGTSMKHHSLAIAAASLLLMSSISQAQTVRRWHFNKIDDREGWAVQAGARGVVMGGALWLTVAPTLKVSARYYEGVGDQLSFGQFAEPASNLISSPTGLNIPAAEVTQVRLRVLNLSAITDFFVMWRTSGQDWGSNRGDIFAAFKAPTQSKRCTMQADLKQWQDITCYLGGHWQGTLDQIAIRLSDFAQLRGDIWIDWIEIGKGASEPARPRPDVVSDQVVPKVTVPGISQAGFADAFKVMDEALIVDVPVDGFTYPVMGPGGYYGEHWWALDSSLALIGAKWVNQSFAEGVMRGFRDVQASNLDGRIDGCGIDLTRGLPVADVSQTPRYFEMAYDVARRTQDPTLRAQIYESMQRYLDWWLSPVKRDQKTGLVIASCEDCETLGELPDWSAPPYVAPVDLNVAVATGAERTARLASELGKQPEAEHYRQVFRELSQAINTTLWDEKDGVYYNYDLTNEHLRRHLIVSTFDPLRLQIASALQGARLIKKLLDPNEFNWGKYPLTSMAMTDSAYVEASGKYGLSAWNGDIWTYRNIEVVSGLEESGRPDLAAELNWATIKEFHGNYYEFLLPSSGAGAGTNRYTWSASQYIGAIVEHLFGVDFDRLQKRLEIAPHIPEALYGRDLALEDLLLPVGADTRLSVYVRQVSLGAATIRVKITGPLPDGDLLLALPGTAKAAHVSMRRSFAATFR